MITKFNEYINEGLTDQMTPKDDDEVRQNIMNKEGLEKLRYINRYDLKKYFTEEEIQKVYDELNLIEMIDLAAEEDQYDEIKYAIKNFYDKKDQLVHSFDMSPLHQKITRAYDILGVAFEWNQEAFFELVENKYNIKSNLDMMHVDALELMEDEDLVDLYSIMIDKINDLPE